MSTTVWPPISPEELKKAEDASQARELSWLVDSLQETLMQLKSGLEDCARLLAPTEPGSTLVISSLRSESIKGHITRIGNRIIKGSLHLRLRTHHPLHLAVSSTTPLVLEPLVSLRSLVNQALDCVDITIWTGDRQSATFVSSQLRLLHSIITEARSTLKGSAAGHPTSTPDESWTSNSLHPASFDPPLTPDISFALSIQEAAFVLVVRTLEHADAVPNIGSRFALAIGAVRKLEHDEADMVFVVGGREVRVKEKIRVESADPSLMAAMAKLAALEHTVGMARKCLSIVMEDETEEN